MADAKNPTVTLDQYLAARDLAIATNGKLIQARKDLASQARRVQRLETEAKEHEMNAVELKKHLDAGTVSPVKTGK